MGAAAVILGGVAGFLGAVVALVAGLPLLMALGIWSLGGAGLAAGLIVVGLLPRQSATLAEDHRQHA